MNPAWYISEGPGQAGLHLLFNNPAKDAAIHLGQLRMRMHSLPKNPSLEVMESIETLYRKGGTKREKLEVVAQVCDPRAGETDLPDLLTTGR